MGGEGGLRVLKGFASPQLRCYHTSSRDIYSDFFSPLCCETSRTAVNYHRPYCQRGYWHLAVGKLMRVIPAYNRSSFHANTAASPQQQ